MLKVGLDLRPGEPGFKAHYGRGTGRYATQLVKHLMALGAQPDLAVEPISGQLLRATKAQQQMLSVAPFGKITLETQVFLPQRVKKLPLDAIHFFSHGDAPFRCPMPYIASVLDLIPLKFPELYKPETASWRFNLARSLENKAIARAKGIIAISNCTKNDLIEVLGIDEERIFVTPLAIGEEFRPRASGADGVKVQMTSIRTRLGLDPERPMLLYVGGIDPRKNITFLLEMFADVLAHGDLTPRPQLVLVGRYEKDDCYPKLLSDIQRLNLKEDVKLLGFISDEELPSVYQAASITLFPSLYEGFGLPVLESLAAGVPVIAARNSSITEVGAGAAVLLPDNKKDIWARATIELLKSFNEQLRLSALGLKRAEMFSWEQTALLTLEAYRYFFKRSSVTTRFNGQSKEAALF